MFFYLELAYLCTVAGLGLATLHVLEKLARTLLALKYPTPIKPKDNADLAGVVQKLQAEVTELHNIYQGGRMGKRGGV